MPIAREFVLRRRPVGLPDPSIFDVVERELPPLADGEILVRNHYLSVDPYMRGRMDDRPSYIPPFALDTPLDGAAAGVIEASRSPAFREGDAVIHFAGWRDRAVLPATQATPIDLETAPMTAWLGPLGVPGLTAYVGLHGLCKVSAGETVLVTGASGAVGSIAVQLARLAGARVIASAGSEEKLAWLSGELGASAVINYRTQPDFAEALARVCPEGVDVVFDNVGGVQLDAALCHASVGARFALCGMIADYNRTGPGDGLKHMFQAVVKRISLKGFIVTDHDDLRQSAVELISGYIRDGSLIWRDTMRSGLDAAPGAFLELFEGGNVGKMLVDVRD